MNGLIKRNLKIFFRDKSAVFFSLLGALIIILLYAFFLHDSYTLSTEGMQGVDYLFNAWTMGALITVASITSCLGGYGIMIADEYNKHSKDFMSSPLKTSEIICSYIANGFIISVVMTFATLFFSEVYILVDGGELMRIKEFAQFVPILLLTCLSSNAVMCFIATFLHSAESYNGCSVLVGTLIGFLVGAYVPLGRMPEVVRSILSVLPCTQSASLMRQLLVERASEISFAGVTSEDYSSFCKAMGIQLYLGNHTFAVWESILIIFASIIVFYLLALFRITRLRKHRKG